MTCTADTLSSTIQSFSGGSDGRYRHAIHRRVIYTEGLKAVAEKAEAYWLIDDMALFAAPRYAKAWLEGKAGIGVVKLVVADSKASMTLSLDDNVAPELLQDIPYTDFPEGEWTFFLGTDEDTTGYITTMYLTSEH